jgi:hypothetical protein
MAKEEAKKAAAKKPAAAGKAAEAIATARKERGVALFLLDLPPDEIVGMPFAGQQCRSDP